MLFGLVCVAVIATVSLYRRARRKRLIRQRVLAEIDALAARHPEDDAAYATALHQLLRRAALRYAPDAHVTRGEHWRQVLAGVPADDATLDALMTLEARMYQPRAEFDRRGVQAAAQRWLAAAVRHANVGEPGHA
ncbi:hypothetical protein GCM10007863_12950 [Dyella mobilis]|nr:hypothetical protein GCM10007863_12950 [Dyella mobilis]